MEKKFFLNAFAFCMAVALPFVTSCNSDDDEPEIEPVIPSEYIYVLNSGDWGANNATLSLFNLKDGTVTKDVFQPQNGRRLGDTGQDIVVYGSKMYIAMSIESTIEITDLEAKSLRQIKTEGQPRAFAVHQGKVYVTYYNGYVARIDTASMEVEAKVQVGRNPERVAVAGNKLYVANSGGLDFNTETGYDKTVSVIDIASFSEIKKIEVVINPDHVVADPNGSVYVISKGNYGMSDPAIPNTLQRIDTNTDEVVTMGNATMMTMAGNNLYYVYSQWEEEIAAEKTNYYVYNTTSHTVVSDNFIGDTKITSRLCEINYDATYEHLFITTSDYTSDGDVYIFDQSNRFVQKFEAGLNPMKAVYVKK